jgi:hypothetical protein
MSDHHIDVMPTNREDIALICSCGWADYDTFGGEPSVSLERINEVASRHIATATSPEEQP